MAYRPIGETIDGPVYHLPAYDRAVIHVQRMRVLYDSISRFEGLSGLVVTRGTLEHIPDLSQRIALGIIDVSGNKLKELNLYINDQIPSPKVKVLQKVDVRHNLITKLILDRPFDTLYMSNNPMVRIIFGPRVQLHISRTYKTARKVYVFCSYSQVPVLDPAYISRRCEEIRPDYLESHILES